METKDNSLVDQAPPLENPSIRGYQFSGRDKDHIVRFKVLDRDLDAYTIRL